jgi:hypothetical protein
MHKITKTAGAGVAAMAMVALTAGTASAESTIVKIGKNGDLSASHKIAWVRAKVTCSEDVTDAYLQATLYQVTVGNAQVATGSVESIGAFECSGREEVVYVPVRRPVGGFKWEEGRARVQCLIFETWDPGNGYDYDKAKGRTINLR